MIRYGRLWLCALLVLAAALPPLAGAQARAVATPATTTAAVDYFLKLDGIPGESTDKDHKGWIEISSYSWGVSNQGSGAGSMGAGRMAAAGQPPQGPGTLTLRKRIDKASPLLAKRCSDKRTPQNVTVHLPSSAGSGYAEYVLYNAVMANCGQTQASESISLNFEKITMKSVPAPARSPAR
jgi:type VI secretion system secreted protein Hcp